MFLFSIVLFYRVQHIHIRSFLRYLNSIPYAEGLCNQERTENEEGKAIREPGTLDEYF